MVSPFSFGERRSMAATRLITMHQNKGKSISASIGDRLRYAGNGKKTKDGEFVSSYACDPRTAEEEFVLSKQEYLRITGRTVKGDILAYQIRQSFKPGEVTPEEANEIGYETAMRFTKGQHAFVVATHVDRAHIHNHVIYNSTTLDCTRKFRDFFLAGKALQRLSDQICLEHGLSVITPRPYGERKQEKDEFVFPAGKKNQKKLDLLVDIQKKMQEGKGAGYERWAKVFNVKQMAKVLLFLAEKGIRDYDTLAEKADAASQQFDEMLKKIKANERRLNDIYVLKHHIIDYAKTRDIYVEYRKSGYSKDFYEKHRKDITIHQAAKVAFSAFEYGKVPKVKDLKEEYCEVLEDIRKCYQE